MNKFLARILRMWDPRPMLAKEWFAEAETYEERLRGNQHLKQEVIEAIIQEKNRLHALFSQLLPEFKERISIVITKDAQVEHCAVFSWNGHLFVLVSAALIGRPYDHPTNSGLQAWDWLARHEAVHIRNGHLPWLFHTRRLFKFGTILFYVQWLTLTLFATQQTRTEWSLYCLWALGALWFTQMIVSLAFEWKADLIATHAIKDPQILAEAESSLTRMTTQAQKRFAAPLGWIHYAVSMLITDPHPPLVARRWLLRRRLRALEKEAQLKSFTASQQERPNIDA